MSTYVIGDIQGCYRTLKRLLKRISFKEQSDRILLVGDLVNRGPDSVDVLRWAKGLSGRLESVLGNHDLHLLALVEGVELAKKQKGLLPIMKARDKSSLIDWLRQRPLVHQEGRMLLTHAGLLPDWTAQQALDFGRSLSQIIRSKRAKDFYQFWYNLDAHVFSTEVSVIEQQCAALSAFTRMRMCKSPTEMDFTFTGHPKDAPMGLVPWYAYEARKSRDYFIVFGHWAALGYYHGHNVLGLDTGCVWGRQLTAYRLEDGAVFSEDSADRKP